MEKLLEVRRKLAKNSKKGFTLVELLVVIVIIAILVAALVPVVLGAIEQANVVADQADARTVLTATGVALIDRYGGIQDPEDVDPDDVTLQIAMTEQMVEDMEFTVYIGDDGMPVGVTWYGGRQEIVEEIGETGGDLEYIGPIIPRESD